MAKGFNIRAFLGLDTKKFTKGLGRAQRGMTKMQRTLRSTNDVLRGLKFAAVGVTAVGAFSRAVNVAKDFQTQMARVAVVSRATNEEVEQLEATARDIGSTTRFSATEAAQGLQFLSMAGLDASESIASIEPALNLAAAGAIEVGRSADIVTNVLSGFGLEAEEAARISNTFAQASRVSNQTVEELYEGVVKIAPAYRNLGLSIEQASADMALLANSGVKAGDAGTALAGALKFLLIQPPRVSKALKELGVEVTENSIRQDGLVGTVERLRDAGINATQMTQIFGLHWKTAGALVAKSRKEIEDMNAEIRDNENAAKDMAEKGIGEIDKAIKLFNSALDELFIELSKVDGIFITLINGARDVVLWFTKLADAEKVLSVALIALSFNLGKVIKHIRVLNILMGVGGLSGGMKSATKGMFLFKRGIVAASAQLAVAVALVSAFIKNVSDLSDEMDKNAKSADQYKSDIDVLVDTYKNLGKVSDKDLDKGIAAGQRALLKSQEILDGYIDKTAEGAVAEANRIERIKGGLKALSNEAVQRKIIAHQTELELKKQEKRDQLEKERLERLKKEQEAYEADQKELEALKAKNKEMDFLVSKGKIFRNVSAEIASITGEMNAIPASISFFSPTLIAEIEKINEELKETSGTLKEMQIPSVFKSDMQLLKESFDGMGFNVAQLEKSIMSLSKEMSNLAMEGAESFEELGAAMGNIIRDTIKAFIAQGVAAAMASVMGTGPLGLILAPAAAATATTLFNTVVPKFAQGGIVPGTSFSGDKVPALVNSGEAIVNTRQQANFMKLANGMGIGGQNGEVVFEIRQDKLVGVLRNGQTKNKNVR